MEEVKKMKLFAIMTRKDLENVERMLSNLYTEVLAARTLLQSVIDANDSDIFREARMYLAEGECSKAVGTADALIRFIDIKATNEGKDEH